MTLRAILAVAIAAPLAAVAQQQPTRVDDFPNHPIQLVIPFAPGGTTDVIGRIAGQKLGAELKQPVVVDNRAGAGGTLGAAHVAKAAADGYTVLLATVAHAIAPAIYRHLSYDFQKDLDPIGLVASTPNVVVINPALPVDTIPELIDYIKAHPGQVAYGSAGIGSTEHLSGELFRAMTGTPMIHVPYKGVAPMMDDLAGGQVQMAIETSPSAEPQLRAGKVKVLAVTTKQRSAAHPGVPTLDEAGVKGCDVATWFALMAPHGTPEAVQLRLAAALAAVLADPEIVKRFQEQGVSASAMTPKQLAAFIASETAQWAKIAKGASITAQ